MSTDPINPDEGVEYGLVMPFPTTDEGGPHDGASYVAGFEMGALDAILRMAALPSPALHKITMGLHRENVPQADLIAMKYRFSFEYEALGDDGSGWVEATFETILESLP